MDSLRKLFSSDKDKKESSSAAGGGATDAHAAAASSTSRGAATATSQGKPPSRTIFTKATDVNAGIAGSARPPQQADPVARRSASGTDRSCVALYAQIIERCSESCSLYMLSCPRHCWS